MFIISYLEGFFFTVLIQELFQNYIFKKSYFFSIYKKLYWIHKYELNFISDVLEFCKSYNYVNSYLL